LPDTFLVVKSIERGLVEGSIDFSLAEIHEKRLTSLSEIDRYRLRIREKARELLVDTHAPFMTYHLSDIP